MVASAMTQGTNALPLCVDLDGTLIKTDLLVESLIQLMKRDMRAFLATIPKIFSGRAALKSELAKKIDILPELLPYNEEVLQYIKEAKAEGRKIVLVTASPEKYAEKIASHLDLFDEVFGSSEEVNLKGSKKAKFLKEQFSEFEYIGDTTADLPVWNAASKVSVVPQTRGVLRTVRGRFKEARVLSEPTSLSVIPRALRVHQWVKNLLLFVPLLMAHKFFDLAVIGETLIGFAAFSLSASSVYILNDLFDLENDRRHLTKSKRPFAAGDLMPQRGIFLIGVLLSTALLLSFMLPTQFVTVLLGYLTITTFYSLYLKQIAVLDIVTLASLYTVRIIAGGAAGGVLVSEWLLGFSMFMFLSLACVKRFSELFSLKERNQESAIGRGYRASDLEQVAIFGSTSGYLSVLVLALYISSPDVVKLYQHPTALWLLCPAVLYWITRIWLLVRRDEVHEDPILFALHDKVSYRVLFISLIIIFLAL